jgi:dihydrofolate reductase
LEDIKVEACWVIGGASLYEEAVTESLTHRIYLTVIESHFDCDTFFPQVDLTKFQEVYDPNVAQELQCEDGIEYLYKVYERIS